MQINSIDDALSLPLGKWFLQTGLCDLNGNITPEILQSYGEQLSFPLDAKSQGEIIARGYLRLYPEASCSWESPEETPCPPDPLTP
jgi:hypothetical protein